MNTSTLSEKLLVMELEELREGLKFCAVNPIEGPKERSRAINRIRAIEKELDRMTPPLPTSNTAGPWKYGDKGYELRNGFSGD